MSDPIKGRVWPWNETDLIARLLAEETNLTNCAAARIERTEAKLTKAVEALRKIADYTHIGDRGVTQNAEARVARTTLAKLQGK
jgi:hypothetical protein